jgi:hypothetical protein
VCGPRRTIFCEVGRRRPEARMRGIATLSLSLSLCVSLPFDPIPPCISLLSLLYLSLRVLSALAGLVLYPSFSSRRGILERQWLTIASPRTEDDVLVRDDACHNNDNRSLPLWREMRNPRCPPPPASRPTTAPLNSRICSTDHQRILVRCCSKGRHQCCVAHVRFACLPVRRRLAV